MLIYLLELRRRLINVVICFFSLFLLFFYFANDLFRLFIRPLLQALPCASEIIATQVAAPVFTPLKLAADMAFFFTVPMIIWQGWQFVVPALYQRERRFVLHPLIASFCLFTLGVLFCFYWVLPLMFTFFTLSVPKGVKMLPDMADSVHFITHMLFVFGLCFQLPLFCLLAFRMRWLSMEQLQQVRPYAIVAAFVLGMLLTPPDVLSQILVAIPLCLLFELGILAIRFTERSRKYEE